MNDIIRDGGWKSRKLAFSLFSVLAIFVGAILAAKIPTFAPMYDTLVGGIIAIAGMYLTGTIATKWVGTKAPASVDPKLIAAQKQSLLVDEDAAWEEEASPPPPRFTEEDEG